MKMPLDTGEKPPVKRWRKRRVKGLRGACPP